MSVWIENGAKAGFAGSTQLAAGNSLTHYLLINIDSGPAYCDGMKMHIKSWGNSFNFLPGQPEGNPEWQGLHGFRFAVYDKAPSSNQPGELIYQSGWINPPVTGEYVYRFEPKPILGTKIFVAHTRICAHLTMVDNTPLNMLSDFLQPSEQTQGGWSSGPLMTDSFLRDASSESMSFSINLDEWCAISYTTTLEGSSSGGLGSPTNEGLYTAYGNFVTGQGIELKKVRGLKQINIVPNSQNFKVSKTDEHVYIATEGAGTDVIGRLEPPYTGPADDFYTPSVFELLENPDLHDENISDSLDASSGIAGLDLTDAI